MKKDSLLKKIKIYLFFIIIFVFNGCTAYHHSIQVSSYSANENIGNKYFLQVADNKLKNKNLYFQTQEFEKYIDTILLQKGYVKVNNLRNADQFIVFDYNISEPQVHTYSYDEPVWDTVLRPYTRYRKIDGVYYPYTYWDRDYEIVGYRTRIASKTLYTKSIFLTSFNRLKTKSLWQINGSIVDSSNDLRYSVPFILKGISNYIGTSSGQIINVTIPDDDLDVEMIRRGGITTSTIAK